MVATSDESPPAGSVNRRSRYWIDSTDSVRITGTGGASTDGTRVTRRAGGRHHEGKTIGPKGVEGPNTDSVRITGAGGASTDGTRVTKRSGDGHHEGNVFGGDESSAGTRCCGQPPGHPKAKRHEKSGTRRVSRRDQKTAVVSRGAPGGGGDGGETEGTRVTGEPGRRDEDNRESGVRFSGPGAGAKCCGPTPPGWPR